MDDGQDSRVPPKRKARVRPPPTHSGLFLNVVMFVAIVILALAINGASDIWFSYHEQQALLVRIQREQVKSAVDKISQFLNEITAGLSWETQLSWSDTTLNDWQFDAVRVMRQVPALTEIVQLDATRHEQFRMSREAPDVIESHVIIRAMPLYSGNSQQNLLWAGLLHRQVTAAHDDSDGRRWT